MDDTFSIFFSYCTEDLSRLHERLPQERDIAGLSGRALLLDFVRARNDHMPESDIRFRDSLLFSALDEFVLMNSLPEEAFLVLAAEVALIYSRLACRHHVRGNSRRAARYAYEAMSLKDYLSASLVLPVRDIYREVMSENARNAANVRHAENREIAERIKVWYRENRHRFRSMDAAAQAVIRIEPVAFRTARDHIGAEAKELRSASKP